ncbi:MAG: hypothetical protein AAGA53_17080 [Pseudomonadota bacterium]
MVSELSIEFAIFDLGAIQEMLFLYAGECQHGVDVAERRDG